MGCGLLVPAEKAQLKVVDRIYPNAEDEESEEVDMDESVEELKQPKKDTAPIVIDIEKPLEATPNQNPASNGLKCMRARYALCLNCDTEDDVTENGAYYCIWHPAKCEHGRSPVLKDRF